MHRVCVGFVADDCVQDRAWVVLSADGCERMQKMRWRGEWVAPDGQPVLEWAGKVGQGGWMKIFGRGLRVRECESARVESCEL